METAENEKEHAKLYFKALEGGDVEFTATFPAGIIKDTKENLKAAAVGEHMEWTVLYPQAGDIAEKEGFKDIAFLFRKIAEVETGHEKRYLKLLENLEKGKVFKRDTNVQWKCRNCGSIINGKEAPDSCPACKHPKAYYELFCEPY